MYKLVGGRLGAIAKYLATAAVWYAGRLKKNEKPPPEVTTPPVLDEQEISFCPLCVFPILV